ncbi:MAG: patatin-like phospholipase family protein, partial [Methyloligellaceae bacterium]
AKKPAPMDVLFAASQIQQNSIVNEKLRTRQPEILIRPPVDHIQVLAFYKIKEILAEAAPVKDELKRKLENYFKAAAPQKKS